MSTLYRYTVNWNASSGGPGTSTFHVQSDGPTAAQDAADAIRAMFNALIAMFPTDVSFSFPGEVLLINAPDNTLTGVIPITAPASLTGTSSASYAAPTGARIRWITDGIVRGRRVTGTTFLVPLYSTAFTTDGTVSSTAITAIQGAVDTYLASTDYVPLVYSRPTAASPTGGVYHAITGGSVPDRAAVLRSRRD